MSRSIFIRDAHAIATCDDSMTRLQGMSILIEGNRIVGIGSRQELEPDVPADARVIDASKHAITPGFINCHHHLYQTLTRCIPEVQNAELFDWLIHLYEIWRGITPEHVHVGGLVGLGELLLTGCTLTTDHHYLFPQSTSGELIDAEFQAAAELGIRFHPTRGSMSRGKSEGGLPPDDVVQTAEQILEDSRRVIEKYHCSDPFAMTRVALAPCSPFSVDENIMRETAALARERGVRLHTHLSETEDENAYCAEVYGCRPVELMQRLDWIGDDVWFAHCVCLNEAEVKLFAETKTSVGHCPASNMRLGSGVPPIRELLAAGAQVGLGVDGSASNDSSNMLAELRLALLLQRALKGAAAITVDDVLWMATRGGALTLGHPECGSLEVGKAADLAIWNLDRIGFAGSHDPIAALLLCGDSQIAQWTIVNGEIVVEDGQLCGVKESDIIQRAGDVAADLIRKAKG